MDLQRIMELPGALAAFTLGEGGAMQAHVLREGSGLTPLTLELLARACAANLAIAGMEARGWEALTGQAGFRPLQGFSVVGLEWSVVANGRAAVIVRNHDADYEAAFAALQAGEGGGA